MVLVSDTELIEWLEAQNKQARHSGRCLFRWSTKGRGWRLHETGRAGARTTVREAIAAAMLADAKVALAASLASKKRAR